MYSKIKLMYLDLKHIQQGEDSESIYRDEEPSQRNYLLKTGKFFYLFC